MSKLRNALAAVGALALLALAVGGFAFAGFDPQAFSVYREMLTRLARTGDPAEALAWKAKVKDGLSFDDVEAAIRSAAASLNVRSVGELPLGDQVTAMRGAPWRRLKIYLFCNPLTAAAMIDHSPAYAALLPCRVALVEDNSGALWLYGADMDMMIHGGRPLPPALLAEAERMKASIRAILERGAVGDF